MESSVSMKLMKRIGNLPKVNWEAAYKASQSMNKYIGF